MDNTQETIADIIAEIRHGPFNWSVPADIPGVGKCNYECGRYADRLEAALKREKAKIETEALVTGGIVEAERHKPGNAAAMCEALEYIGHYCDNRDNMDDPCCADGHVLAAKAKAALAAPPRNCDVGTAAEQSDRFAEFCKKHANGCGLGYGSKGIGHPKVTCPAFKDLECALVWAQMPYEAKEGGAPCAS